MLPLLLAGIGRRGCLPECLSAWPLHPTARSHTAPPAGRFGLPEYTMLCLFLMAARNIFAAFDPGHTGRASLDYSQFVYAAANTR